MAILEGARALDVGKSNGVPFFPHRGEEETALPFANLHTTPTYSS